MTKTTAKSATILATLASLLLGSAGCAGWSRTQKGAVIGATAGAAAGAAVGSRTGSRAAAILVGAAVGGTAGAMIGREMDRQARELDIALEGATVERVGEGIVVTFDSGILFDFDSSVLRPVARDNLTRFARSLQEHPRTHVQILGHTDNIGTADYNQRLSERRAASAADHLAASGISRSRVTTMGLGYRDPIATNQTDAGRQLNRRVELVIYADEAWRQEMIRSGGAD
jgi:outer membrane protein OmpA-like peptidoglycan-associated protein